MTSHLTTHVLDTVAGRPAAGVAVRLSRVTGEQSTEIASGVTDGDGRIGELGPARLEPGTYRVSFATGDYFRARGQQTFYPAVHIDVTVADEEHYHVPCLLSPFAYSTYRGS